MSRHAVLLTADSSAVEDRKAGRLLDFFGVPYRRCRPEEFVSELIGEESSSEAIGVVVSADACLQLLKRLDGHAGLFDRLHSVFVYPGSGMPAVAAVASALTGDERANVYPIDAAVEFGFTDRQQSFCAALSGLQVRPVNARGIHALQAASDDLRPLISTPAGAAFARVPFQGVPFFLACGAGIVDVDAGLAGRNFDVRDHLLAAVPLVLYVKWAFATAGWTQADTGACVVIDDPLLQRRYGFLDFSALGTLTERHGFSTSIAFIPWNWRRSDPAVARLFAADPARLSVSIHGCDHTAGEFGSADAEALSAKAHEALARMSRHEAATGIRHDRVMVFPEGVFSATAMRVLKQSGFAAAVNTEVVSSDSPPRTVRVRDVWDTAVMAYDSFPLFTRRYPTQGIENFAFDIVLGKPCIIVIHHEWCRDGGAHLVEFIDRLNALKAPLAWQSLGALVDRACQRRALSADQTTVEMYGTRLTITNRSETRARYLVRRREGDPSIVRQVTSDGKPLLWRHASGSIEFEVELSPLAETSLHVQFRPMSRGRPRPERLAARVRTTARRYLSELRDNYVTTGMASMSALLGHPVRK